jgi:VWFA-related protein
MMRIAGPVVALALLNTIVVTTQTAPPTDGSVFRATAELIRLDVSVTDAAGQAIIGLHPANFTIFQDGQPQAIRFAEFHPGRAGKAPRSPDRSMAGLDAGSSGRRLVFIVDDLHMDFDSVVRVREALATYVNDSLMPGDQLMITGTRDPRRPPDAFTADRKLLGRQILSLDFEPGRAQIGPGTQLVNCRALPVDALDPAVTDGTLAVVTQVLLDLREYPGRKTMMLLADRIDVRCPEYRDSYYERLRRLSDLASRSSAVIYGLHTLHFVSGAVMPEHRGSDDVRGTAAQVTADNLVSDSLRRLSEATGGFARRSNNVRELLDQALEDQQGFYSLAYEPPPGTFVSKKLKYRTLRLRVDRPDAKVRTRGGFYSVTDDAVLLRH